MSFAKSIFIYGEKDFVFKYYNQFFRLKKKNLVPVSGSEVNEFIPVFKIKVKIDDERVNPINYPVIFVEDKQEYGVIINRSINSKNSQLTIKLLSSYFGIDNIIERVYVNEETIEILALKEK